MIPLRTMSNGMVMESRRRMVGENCSVGYKEKMKVQKVKLGGK